MFHIVEDCNFLTEMNNQSFQKRIYSIAFIVYPWSRSNLGTTDLPAAVFGILKGYFTKL